MFWRAVWQAKIFMVARERDVRGVMALMEQDVDPNTSCPERNYTPLIAAVFNQVQKHTNLHLRFFGYTARYVGRGVLCVL